MTCAGTRSPFAKTTVSFVTLPPLGGCSTCALVTMSPCVSMTKPEPDASPL